MTRAHTLLSFVVGAALIALTALGARARIEAPSSTGGGGGGGCPGPACDGEYLRLDGANTTGASAPLDGLTYTTTDPYYGAPALGVTAGGATTWVQDLAGESWILNRGGIETGGTIALRATGSNTIASDGALGVIVDGSGTSRFFLSQLDTGPTYRTVFATTPAFQLVSNTTSPNLVLPQYTFDGDADTGFGRSAANVAAIYAGSSAAPRVTVDSSSVSSTVTYRAPVGGYSWTSDTGTRLTLLATNNVAIQTASTSRQSWQSSQSTMWTPLLFDNTTSTSNVGAGFYNDPNSGIGWIAADTWRTIAGGTETMRHTSSLMTTNVPTRIPAGSVSATSLQVGTNANDGIYSPSAGQVAIAVAGVQRLRADSGNGVVITGNTFVSDTILPTVSTADLGTASFPFRDVLFGGETRATTSGSAAAPSYSWHGDDDNGLYLAATNVPAIASAGNFAAGFGAHSTATSTRGMEAGYTRLASFAQIDETTTADLPTCGSAWSGAIFNTRNPSGDTNLCGCMRHVAGGGWQWRPLASGGVNTCS
jgi:hypothetical protein